MHNSITENYKLFWASIVFAFTMWFMMFVVKAFDFWLTMSFSTFVLFLISVITYKDFFKKEDFTLKNILLGVGSAAGLYLIFFVGHKALLLIERIIPWIPLSVNGNVSAVYSSKSSMSEITIMLLLIFPIGAGEEFFWRGYIQRKAYNFFPGRKYLGFVVSTILYTFVHLSTLNPVLLIAAFFCGAVWGGLYLYTGSLFPVLISHIIWDIAIFIVIPLQR